MPRFDLVIFDCDGVLIDSEVISTNTLLETIRAHGLDVDIAYVRKTYLGRTFSVVKADYRRLVGRDLAESFEAELLERLFAAYRRELKPMPGIVPLIEGLRCSFCMATSSSVERATVSLEVTGLLRFFAGKVFCASMVERGKPAPDLFLHAAQAFGADPARCLVVEDSEVGLLAGRNAGMTVWRFIGGSHFDPAARQAARSAEPGIRVFDRMETMEAALRED
jgi:HAD superfamily hydrolase (TIGR01509 family)